jgi:hypothetical protein
LGQAISDVSRDGDIAEGKKPMQRAGHQLPGTTLATPTPPAAPSATAEALRLIDAQLPACDAEADTVCGDVTVHRGAKQEALEVAIYQRIESRLHGRVRNLAVRAYDDLVILEGECTTYYTKQLAQHAAMGVLDDEQLENAIVVNVPK